MPESERIQNTIGSFKTTINFLQTVLPCLQLQLTQAIMVEDATAHQVADCQFQDGSVIVSWQGFSEKHPLLSEGEEVGTYKTLGEALKAHPNAFPVCFDCQPLLAENEQDTQHDECCSFASGGSETAL